MNSNNDVQDKNESFYRAFEDRFRGTREAIKSRLMVYLPFIEPLKEIYDNCGAIDLGCGRGEWLELVTEAGMIAHGVDLDDSMLEACRERGLSVENRDAVSFLKSLPDKSQAVISGFHVIEHMATADLQNLIQEAFRVLKPAGMLILETPNPESIVVSSTYFHLDPSHKKPIPPQLLAFMTEYYGFYRNKILRLHEPDNPLENNLPNLFHVLYEVSLDYSVVTQKKAPEAQLEIFNAIFERDYGVSLGQLTRNYDIQVAQEVHTNRSEFSRLNAELARLNAEFPRLNAELSRLNIIQIQLNDLYQSHSWRITAPLRAAADFIRKIGRNILQAGSSIFLRGRGKDFLTNTANYIRAHPRLKRQLVRLFGLFPKIDMMVLRLSRRLRNELTENQSMEDNIQNHPLRVQQIHQDLLDTIEQNGTDS